MLARTGLVVALALTVPIAALAQSYRCVDKDGRKHYGATIPAPCVGLTVEQLSPQGSVMRRIEPPPRGEAVAEKDADAQRKRGEDSAARDAARRNRALLETYGSDKDIEQARTRALAENQNATLDVEGRIAGLRKRVADHDRYASVNAPAKPAEEIERARADLKAQEALLATKQREAGVINARYDEDARRFRELSAMDAAARGKALGMEKGVTVTTPPPSAQEQRRQENEARRAAMRDRAELQKLEREHDMERRQIESERRRAEYERRARERQR